jgi:3-oxoacyl-[acyl-carrier protein] reductase
MEIDRKSARLDGRVALITGAGRGMGRAHAVLMAERGADIVVLDRLAEEAEETGTLVRRAGRKAEIVAADVTDLRQMREAVARVEAALGHIDILVNNAGHSGGRGGFETIDESMFDGIFAVHVKGAFFLTQAVVPGMKARRYGKIVNISSTMALTGLSYAHHYSGAKAALLAFTKGWAKELVSYNICVNAVAPGGVLTPMTINMDGMEKIREKQKGVPMQRYASPEEIAYAVAFLASPESDFITGQVISPNGGDVIVGI